MELQRMLSSQSDASFAENLTFRSIEEFADHLEESGMFGEARSELIR